MILLDTNVVSELLRASGDMAACAWLGLIWAPQQGQGQVLSMSEQAVNLKKEEK